MTVYLDAQGACPCPNLTGHATTCPLHPRYGQFVAAIRDAQATIQRQPVPRDLGVLWPPTTPDA